jgi:hypothetical protein
MRLKDIGKKIGDIAFRLAMYSCERAGECGSCAGCGYYVNPSPSMLENIKKSGDNKGK